jgi:O-antigen/teichoic acid export membrane protein
VGLVYGLICGGLLYLLAEPLCARLYPGEEVAGLLRRFALLVPMLYCDLLADAMTKGLGQQAAVARYSVISNVLDVAMMYFLLPDEMSATDWAVEWLQDAEHRRIAKAFEKKFFACFK